MAARGGGRPFWHQSAPRSTLVRGPWFTPDLTWPVLGVPPGQPCVPSGECRWKCAHQCFKQGPSGARVYTQVGAWRQGSESPREARGACAQRLGSSLQLVREAGGPGWPRSPGWPPPTQKVPLTSHSGPQSALSEGPGKIPKCACACPGAAVANDHKQAA